MVPVPSGNTGMTLNFGSTELDAGDFIPPRIKVVQMMSHEAVEKLAAAGELVNTLTGENYGEAMRFVPIQPSKQRVFLMRKERAEAVADKLGHAVEADGLACRSFNMIHGQGEPGGLCSACPLANWDGPNPPLCSEVYNVAAADESGALVILSFSKSSAKAGKQLFSAMALGSAQPWSRVWTLTTALKRNDQGSFYQLVPTMTKDAPAPEIMKVIRERWVPALTGGAIVIDATEDMAREAEQTEEGAAF